MITLPSPARFDPLNTVHGAWRRSAPGFGAQSGARKAPRLKRCWRAAGAGPQALHRPEDSPMQVPRLWVNADLRAMGTWAKHLGLPCKQHPELRDEVVVGSSPSSAWAKKVGWRRRVGVATPLVRGGGSVGPHHGRRQYLLWGRIHPVT